MLWRFPEQGPPRSYGLPLLCGRDIMGEMGKLNLWPFDFFLIFFLIIFSFML